MKRIFYTYSTLLVLLCSCNRTPDSNESKDIQTSKGTVTLTSDSMEFHGTYSGVRLLENNIAVDISPKEHEKLKKFTISLVGNTLSIKLDGYEISKEVTLPKPIADGIVILPIGSSTSSPAEIDAIREGLELLFEVEQIEQ